MAVDPRDRALNIHALTIDGGWLWVGTYGDGLYRIDLRTRQMKHFTQAGTGLDNLDVYSVFRDSRGQLWIGTKMGICRYDDVSRPSRAHSAWDITATWWTSARMPAGTCGSRRWARG